MAIDSVLTVGVTRRSVLKSGAAALAAAALASCSSGEEDDLQVLSPQEGLKYDEELNVCFSSGPYNCGAKCLHKIHYKNGKLYHLTSAGDIPREGTYAKDNSEGTFDSPIQRRACVRGYGYFQRLYQPDRLKYPLMRVDKSIPRGDPKISHPPASLGNR
jgi:anaerobic dimethyl sulfoxide reductase subunit A